MTCSATLAPPLNETATAYGRRPRAAIIVNSAKFSDPLASRRFQQRVEEAFARREWATPLWLPTTSSTLGADEARAALTSEVDLVLVAGGDGTIRTVADQLIGSRVPLAVLPVGTGNLLARNLGIPLNNVDAAVEVACSASNELIDVGWLQLDPDQDGPRHHFLVMAGTGFDAEVMSNTRADVKSKLGPFAYALGALPVARRRGSSGTLFVDGTRFRSGSPSGFVVGNFGTLPLGAALMPDASPNDGALDAVLLLAESPLDWVRAAWSVVRPGEAPHALLPRARGLTFDFHSQSARPVEVDGDVVGDARHVRAGVDARALVVRSARRLARSERPLAIDPAPAGSPAAAR